MIDFLSGNRFSIISIIGVVLFFLFGIQTKRINSAKKKVEEQKGVIKDLTKVSETQKKVVEDYESEKGRFIKQKGDVLEEIAPEINKVKDIPEAEKKPLSDTVKKAASSQADRINARKKK
ncbi:MAG: hypothetical protein EOM85_03670 [Candidatus Moranbacteria bacterium]|nr:hypothetical protein [Candidatus Moranbacteria bacterium]